MVSAADIKDLIGPVGLVLVLAFIRSIARRSVQLYGHCFTWTDAKISHAPDGPLEDEQPATCKFAIQNAESVAIDTPLRATIKVVSDRGQILEDRAERPNPRLFAGIHRVRGTRALDRRSVTIECEGLPAYGTWVIDCDVDAPTSEIAIELAESLPRLIPAVPPMKLVLSRADPLRIEGAARLPDISLVLWSLVLGVGTYALTVAALRESWSFVPWDAGCAVGIGSIAWFAVKWTQRREPSVIQGYWNETPVDWAAETESSRSDPIAPGESPTSASA